MREVTRGRHGFAVRCALRRHTRHGVGAEGRPKTGSSGGSNAPRPHRDEDRLRNNGSPAGACHRTRRRRDLVANDDSAMRYDWCSPNLQPKSEPKPSNQVSEVPSPGCLHDQCRGMRECRQLARLAGNEGVGEHVRTRFRTGRSSGETAAPPKGKDPHRTKKPGFFYWTNSMTVQPLDLMSRRHPLSSTGALWFVPSAPMTCRQRSPPASQ